MSFFVSSFWKRSRAVLFLSVLFNMEFSLRLRFLLTIALLLRNGESLFASKQYERSLCRRRVITYQLPPKGSRFLTEEDEEMQQVHEAFRAHPEYHPIDHPGTMKPGSTPENSPLSDILKLKPPQRAPYFQEVPFHIRWPASHPASQPLIEWLADSGHLMSEEEEEELEVRSRRAAASRLPSTPQMISPENIEDELLGNQGSDESLLSEVLGMDSAMSNSNSYSTETKNKNWTAKKQRVNSKPSTSISSAGEGMDSLDSQSMDESLLSEVLGDLEM